MKCAPSWVPRAALGDLLGVLGFLGIPALGFLLVNLGCWSGRGCLCCGCLARTSLARQVAYRPAHISRYSDIAFIRGYTADLQQHSRQQAVLLAVPLRN